MDISTAVLCPALRQYSFRVTAHRVQLACHSKKTQRALEHWPSRDCQCTIGVFHHKALVALPAQRRVKRSRYKQKQIEFLAQSLILPRVILKMLSLLVQLALVAAASSLSVRRHYDHYNKACMDTDVVADMLVSGDHKTHAIEIHATDGCRGYPYRSIYISPDQPFAMGQSRCKLVSARLGYEIQCVHATSASHILRPPGLGQCMKSNLPQTMYTSERQWRWFVMTSWRLVGFASPAEAAAHARRVFGHQTHDLHALTKSYSSIRGTVNAYGSVAQGVIWAASKYPGAASFAMRQGSAKAAELFIARQTENELDIFDLGGLSSIFNNPILITVLEQFLGITLPDTSLLSDPATQGQFMSELLNTVLSRSSGSTSSAGGVSANKVLIAVFAVVVVCVKSVV